MVTENQMNVDKLIKTVSARKNTQNAIDALNMFKHALGDIKTDLVDITELNDETKEVFLEFDSQLYEISKFLSKQNDVLYSKKFQYERELFNALGWVE